MSFILPKVVHDYQPCGQQLTTLLTLFASSGYHSRLVRVDNTVFYVFVTFQIRWSV